MTDSRDLGAALLMGLGGGLRSFAPPVALAVHGRGPLTGRARFIAFGAGAAELIADKLPKTPSRWSARGISGRLAFSGAAGRALGAVRLATDTAHADPAVASAEEVVLLAIEHGPLGDVLARLSPELRAALQATVLDGLTCAEAGRLLGIPAGTVKSRCHRARIELREALA